VSKLQLRLQQHRRRRELPNKLRKAGWLAAAAVLFCFLLQLPATGAFFTDKAETDEFSFRATTFADNLALTPGDSKTNDSPEDPGPAFYVAQTSDGQITLNFGTYPAGNNKNFPAVLVVRNIGGRALTLNWSFCGVLAPFFEQQEGSVTVALDGESALGFKLNTNPQYRHGEYHGTLHLSALGGFITAELPVRLHLAAKQEKDAKDKDKDMDKDKQDQAGKGKQGQQDLDKAAAAVLPAVAADGKDAKAGQDKSKRDEAGSQVDQAPDNAIETVAQPQGTGEASSPGASGDNTRGTGGENVGQGLSTEGGGDSGKTVEQSPTH